MDNKQIESCMRLFKGYYDDSNEKKIIKEAVKQINEDFFSYGLILAEPEHNISQTVINEAIKQYGKDGEAWNQTFHKSFKTVMETPIETLIAQQLIHYFTTYGLESLGLADSNLVYIPHEQLDIPELQEDIPLIVIHRFTSEVLRDKLMTLLNSGIALSETTVEDIMNLSDFIDKEDIYTIKNREVKMALYEKYNIVPRNNMEFLRYLILKTTDSTLLIQNDDMIKTIKDLDSEKYKLAYDLINNYVSTKGGYEQLAEIFLRYKNLFLAFKRTSCIIRSASEEKYGSSMNKIINRISKLSKTYHKPIESNILDDLTQINSLNLFKHYKPEILAELNNITIFREIRILNALLYRINAQDNFSIVYRVRNGKGFVKNNLQITDRHKNTLSTIYDLILNHLKDRLNKNLKNKSIYIPEEVNYTVPTSEKQFINNIPEGSYIEVPRTSSMVLGIHWKNLGRERVDLDLHAQNRNEQFGWNTSYRSSQNDFVFTGDVTDAPEPYGATELFYIGQNASNRAFLLTLNNYTSNSRDVPYEFVVARCFEDEVNKNYALNPNNIDLILNKVVKKDERNTTVGFIEIQDEYIRFYFNDYSIGNSIVTRQNDVTIGAFNYSSAYTKTQLKLKNLLQICDCTLLDEPEKEELQEVTITNESGEQETLYKKVKVKADIDLSLDKIDKETLIKLFMEE